MDYETLLTSLNWSKPTRHLIDRQHKFLQSALPTPDFWEWWRGLDTKEKSELYDKGIYVRKFGRAKWTVFRWTTADGSGQAAF